MVAEQVVELVDRTSRDRPVQAKTVAVGVSNIPVAMQTKTDRA